MTSMGWQTAQFPLKINCGVLRLRSLRRPLSRPATHRKSSTGRGQPTARALGPMEFVAGTNRSPVGASD